MKFVKKFEEVSKKDILLVGGKATSLGEMTNAGISIPSGLVITTRAYEEIRKSIPTEVEKEILEAFDSLKTKRVAVRSSAIAEDSLTSSWAGQLESYLNVTREKLIDNIRKCWNSIKSERALAYAADQNLPKNKLLVAVVVQKMIDSKISGVIFTANPITNNLQEIMIESGLGLGESLVSGMITPDNFIVDKKTLAIKNKTIQTNKTTLSDGQIKDLANLSLQIEKYFHAPQDIEWAIDKNNKVWILQSRPITTLSEV